MMKHSRKRCCLLLLLALAAVVCCVPAEASGASISGTMYQSDGTTPLTGQRIFVMAKTGSDCNNLTMRGSGWSNATTGDYTITDLPPGMYYMQTGSSAYISEWWAEEESVRDCTGAQTIEVTSEGQVVTGINFQLDTGATISGTVYQSDGTTPLTGQDIQVYAFTGSACGSPVFGGYTSIDSDGKYAIQGLPAGTYYLQTSSPDFISEWWAEEESVRDCTGAQTIAVTSAGQVVTGKNFQLDTGATVVVNPEPDSINAPWTLTGPGSYSQSGAGDQTLNNLPSGDYTIAWGDVAGWRSPSPATETKAVTGGGTTSFTGAYSQARGGGFFVIPNKKGGGAVIYLE